MIFSYGVAVNLLEQVTNKNWGWHTQDSKAAIGSFTTSYFNKLQQKKEEERNKNMENIMKKLNLLTKHMMQEVYKAFNVIDSHGTKSYDDDGYKELNENITSWGVPVPPTKGKVGINVGMT